MSSPWIVIANPVAGGGRAARRLLELEGSFASPIQVHETGGPRDAERLARELDLEAAPGLIVVGGDGTVHEVVQGLFAREDGARPPLGVLPAGTGDALARDLGLSDPVSALTALGGPTRAIDLAEVTLDGEKVFCFSVIGWGAFARINRRAERYRWARGRRYDLAALLELLTPGAVRPAGARRQGRAEQPLLGVVCLTRHTGKGMRMAPGAELDDGLADLVEIDRSGRLRLVRLLSQVFDGSHVRSPLVHVERVSQLEVDLDPDSYVILDGEAVPARHLSLRIRPRALSLFAPAPSGR